MRLHIDASTALGIIGRRGVGRVRHLEVGSVWIQEQQLKRIVDMFKVPALENPADLITKRLNCERISVCADLIGYFVESGRATTTADLHMLRPPGGRVALMTTTDLVSSSSTHVCS